MTTVTVSPDSFSFLFGASVSGSGTVGTWPVLADGDDATYVEVASDFAANVGDEADFLFTTPAGSGSGTGADVTVHLRLKVDDGDEVVHDESRVRVFIFDTAGDAGGVWIGSIPDPSIWYDDGLPIGTPLGGGAGAEWVDPSDSDHWWIFQNQTTGSGDADDPWPDFLPALAAGTLEVDISRVESAGTVDDGAHRNVKIAQFTLTIPASVSTVIPPLRQYPRSDGLGASTVRRLWPLPNTIQASNRRGPSAIL